MKNGYSCYYMLATGDLPSKHFCEKRVECKYCEFYPPRNKAQGGNLIPVECRECVSFHEEGRTSVPCRGDFDPHNCESSEINEPPKEVEKL